MYIWINRFLKMIGFVVSFILCSCVVHVGSECTKIFLFDTAFVDSKLTNYFETTTLESKLDCSRRCQDMEYCTGFSYKVTSGRCELYDEVISTAQTELAAGTVTYKFNEVCGPPQSIPNINTQPADQYYLPGYLMLYDCLPGSYQNSSIVCSQDGTWNTSAVSCQYGKTCADAADHGVSVGSTLIVEPIESSDPVQVKCKHRYNKYDTIIDTTWNNNIKLQGHVGTRSGVYDVNYSIGLNYISVIADSSTYCYQYMKITCQGSILTKDSGWRTRDGSLADYFFGGVKGQMNCACKEDNSCYNGLDCNCNAGDSTERQDKGYATYKDDLPITAFLSGNTDDPGDYYYVQICSLTCVGMLS